MPGWEAGQLNPGLILFSVTHYDYGLRGTPAKNHSYLESVIVRAIQVIYGSHGFPYYPSQSYKIASKTGLFETITVSRIA